MKNRRTAVRSPTVPLLAVVVVAACVLVATAATPASALTFSNTVPTNAPVPVRVGDPASGCAGNTIAGQAALTGNLAVMFGANTVSNSATIDSNGPGATLVKANNLFGTLACSRNDPTPNIAGQVNTAAAKTRPVRRL